MPQLTLKQAFDLAVQHHEAGRLQQAEHLYRQILALRPAHADTLHLLGVIAHQMGRHGDAIDLIRQAIALRPNVPEAYSNLGASLKDQGQLDEAMTAYRQALALKPNMPEAHNNLGVTLKGLGRLDEAIAALRQAIALNPNYAGAHSNLVFDMNYHPGYDARAIAEELRRWNRQHAEPLQKFIEPHSNDRNPDRRLRIGYVSADFWAHASAYFLSPLLEHHDAHEVELFCYAQVFRSDAVTRQLQQRTAQWRSIVDLSDEQAARQIRDDRIDILVDLKLHTAQNRLLLFARKPAPVQVTWLGYPGSTGLSTIDYRLSDPYLDPPGMDESVYSEKTIRLPDTFWCYDPMDGRDLPVNVLPAQASSRITFGCLNNFCKVNDAVLRLWAKVMLAVPSSQLLLLIPEGTSRERTLAFLTNEGIAPERIEFVSNQPRKQYMELYHRIDVGLDTFICNGHTTSLDSFWMGVPVVTLAGSTAVGRAGLCQLMNLKLPGLIAHTPEQYVQIATDLAGDLPRLATLRSTLRQRMAQSPLMDAPRFARGIEAAYRQIWRAWCTTSPATRV